MTRAAERLHVSQSTMSKQLKELENELRSKLFVRTNYSIKLTDSGMLLKKRAEDILALVEKTEAGIEYAVVIDMLIDTGESSDLTFRPLTDVPGTGLYVIWRKYQTFTPASQLLIDELEKRFRSNNTSEKSRA